MGGRRKRRRPAVVRRPAPGAPPGTLSISPDALESKVRVFGYGPDGYLEREASDPNELARLMDEWPVTWVDVTGLGGESTLRALGRVFSLHPLALSDVVHVHQRAKVDAYDGRLFVVARSIALGGTMESQQVSLVLGPRFVVSFRERSSDDWEPVRECIRTAHGALRTSGPDHLVYALLDGVIDHYFPVLEAYGERLEELEEAVIRDPDPKTLAGVHDARHTLGSLRRIIWPHREALAELLRDTSALISDETKVYLRDSYDHVVQIVEIVESYRELAASLFDVYLSSMSNRMNEVMKVLTMFATVFIPLTFIAGIYGMNFDPATSTLNMPELRWRWGYPVVLGGMAAIAIGMILYFRRKGWLGSRSQSPGP